MPVGLLIFVIYCNLQNPSAVEGARQNYGSFICNNLTFLFPFYKGAFKFIALVQGPVQFNPGKNKKL